MEKNSDLIQQIVEILYKKAETPEEKRIHALLKAALLADSLLKFINEVDAVSSGLGKVRTQTVKDLVEYAKAHNEAQIRTTYEASDDVDIIVAQENDRLTVAELWTLGALAYLGVLD